MSANPIDPTKWAVRNQAAPHGAVPTLAQIGPSPGTFSGDFLRQLAIALCVGGAIYWLVDRKKAPAGPQILVVHPDDLDAFEALQGGGEMREMRETRARDAYAAGAHLRDGWRR
jgi:hypothetical protein